MKPFIESIQDLKDNREEIIEAIKGEANTEDMYVVKNIMQQVVNIVTASNYSELNVDVYETIEMAVKDITSKKINTTVDMREVNRINAMKNLPSSMR